MPLPGDAPRCTAKSKRSGERCQNVAVNGSDKCRMHGGIVKTRGAQNGNFRHGRYSDVLTQRVLPKYREALQDHDFLVQQEEIALVEGLLKEQLLNKRDGGSVSVPLVRQMRQKAKTYRDSMRKADRAQRMQKLDEAGSYLDTANEALEQLFGLLDSGLTETIANEQISKLINQKARIIESERRRMIENKQVMAMDEVIVLMSAVTDVFVQSLDVLPENMRETVIGPALDGIVRLQNARTAFRVGSAAASGGVNPSQN
jgi:hypothetical protein